MLSGNRMNLHLVWRLLCASRTTTLMKYSTLSCSQYLWQASLGPCACANATYASLTHSPGLPFQNQFTLCLESGCTNCLSWNGKIQTHSTITCEDPYGFKWLGLTLDIQNPTGYIRCKCSLPSRQQVCSLTSFHFFSGRQYWARISFWKG